MPKRAITTRKDIGRRIKEQRKELMISQEELAEKIGVTYQQVQRYENGANKLNVENIQVIADALTVPVSYFFDGAEKPMASLSAEERKLLKYFRRVRSSGYKNLVLQVVKLASTGKTY